MQNQSDRTDLVSFLCKISNKLIKEGNSLQALGELWFDKKDEKLIVLNEFGIDINNLGEQLLELQKHLCQTCAMKSVTVTQYFIDSDEERD